MKPKSFLTAIASAVVIASGSLYIYGVYSESVNKRLAAEYESCLAESSHIRAIGLISSANNASGQCLIKKGWRKEDVARVLAIDF